MANNPEGGTSIISRRNLLIGGGVLAVATAITLVDKKDEIDKGIDDIKLSVEASKIFGALSLLFESSLVIDNDLNFYPEQLSEQPELLKEIVDNLFGGLVVAIQKIEIMYKKDMHLSVNFCYFLHFYIEQFKESLNGDNMHALANSARKIFELVGQAKNLIDENKDWDDTCIMGNDVNGTMEEWIESLGDKINEPKVVPVSIPGVKVELERKDLLNLLASFEDLMKTLPVFQEALAEIADPEVTSLSNNESFNSIFGGNKAADVPFNFEITEAYDKIYEAYVLQEEVARLKKEGKPNKASDMELDLERESNLYGTFVIMGIIHDPRYVIETKSDSPRTAKDAVEISTAVKKSLERFKITEKTVLDAYKQYSATGKKSSHEDIRIFQQMLAWGDFYDYRKINGKMDSYMASAISKFKDVNMKASEVYDLEEKHEDTDG